LTEHKNRGDIVISKWCIEVALWFLDKERTTDYNNLGFANALPSGFKPCQQRHETKFISTH
jgi:hypothetical protein